MDPTYQVHHIVSQGVICCDVSPVQCPDILEARQKREVFRSGPRDAVHARQRQDGQRRLHCVTEGTAELSAPHALRANGAAIRPV